MEISQDNAARAERLAHELIHPLCAGGVIRLQRPFGARLALALGDQRRIVDDAVRTEIDVARLRVARTLVPVDSLPDIDAREWSLACAFHDLLQSTNHELSSFATRGRHRELIDSVHAVCEAVPQPATLMSAVTRHALFSRALEINRLDRRVAWWTGSSDFRGQEPPARLLAWRELRRVRIHDNLVALAEMDEGTALDPGLYELALASWIARSPLTDLATADRAAPQFTWSPAALSLVTTSRGRDLALRAISVRLDGGPMGALGRAMIDAAVALPEGALQQSAKSFIASLEHAQEHAWL
jgi:hypothetical protein